MVLFHSPPCNEYNYTVHMRYLWGNIHTLAYSVTHTWNAAHPFPPSPDLSLKISPHGKVWQLHIFMSPPSTANSLLFLPQIGEKKLNLYHF